MSENNQIPKLLKGNRVIIVVVICLALTFFLFWNESCKSPISFSAIHWSGSSILFLLLALLMMAFRDLAYMSRIRLLTNRMLSWRQSFNVIMIWEFASALSPGVVGGSAVAMFILRGEKIPLGKATALVIVTAIMDNLFYIVAIPVLFLFISVSQLFPEDLKWIEQGGLTLFWIGYGIVLAITGLLFLSVFYYPKALTSLIRLIFTLPFLKKRKEKGEKINGDIYLASEELKTHNFLFWLRIFGITVWSWTSRYLVINFMLMAFISAGLGDHLLILGRQLVMWLVMLVTPTPGGSGMAEYLFEHFLSDFIANGTLALSLAFLWRMISYYPYLIIGSVVYPRWIRR